MFELGKIGRGVAGGGGGGGGAIPSLSWNRVPAGTVSAQSRQASQQRYGLGTE